MSITEYRDELAQLQKELEEGTLSKKEPVLRSPLLHEAHDYACQLVDELAFITKALPEGSETRNMVSDVWGQALEVLFDIGHASKKVAAATASSEHTSAG